MSEGGRKKTVAFAAAACILMLAVTAEVFGQFRLDSANDRFHPRPSQEELSGAYAQSFSSTLPVLYIRTADKTELTQPDTSQYPYRGEAICEMMVFDGGVNTLSDEPSACYTNVRIKIRGRSSSVQPKQPYAVEFRQESGKPVDQPFLGFDAQSDFVLHAPYMDKTCLHNYLAYTLAGELGAAAPACRLVEVFLCDGTGPVTQEDYLGIYLVVEKVKTKTNPQAVTQYQPGTGESLTERLRTGGGYIVRRDKYDAGTDETTVLPFTTQQYEYQVVYPRSEVLTEKQILAIWNELLFFEELVYSGSYEEMAEWIDLDSFLALIMVNEFALNPEAFEGSAYFYRAVGGRYTAGPLWDLDVAFGSNAGGASSGTMYTQKRLELCYMEHEEFYAQFVQLWQRQRGEDGVFSDAHLSALLEGAVAQMGDALERNAARWPELFDGSTQILANPYCYGSWQESLDALRVYLSERAAWMDAYFCGQ